MPFRLFRLIPLMLSVALSAFANEARPLLSPIFSDHMVVQRGRPNTFWGWANAGETVRVSLGDQTVVTTTDADGCWQVQLTPVYPGGPYTLTVEATTRVEIHDIIPGDVWLCSGQSNMEFPLSRALDGDAEVAAADHPQIRFFKVPQRVRYSPASLPEGTWQLCSPDSVARDGLSAVAYYFARKLHAETGVPIGVVQAAVGGTPAETWMSPESLQPLGEFDRELAEIERLRAAGGPAYGNYIMHWYDAYDIGSREPSWADPAISDAEWKSVSVPGVFKFLGLNEVPAVVWLRKEIELPDPLPAGTARLHLGSVEKMDTAFLNGRWIGASAWVDYSRVYNIPADVLKPGKNLLALRIFKLKSAESFLSAPETLQLELGDGRRIALAGDNWRARLSVDARAPHPLPLGFDNWPTMPAVLHHGMIHPLAPLTLSGVLWYQGEANAERAWQYRRILPALIHDWRRTFQQPDLPFYIVSLPAFMKRAAEPRDDGWAELREAQAFTARTTPHTHIAVTIDTGDADDIHPIDKRPVGERLALLALASHYGKSVVSRGPEFIRAETLPGALRLHFTHIDGGLELRKNDSPGFAVAGEDRRWFWATAKLDGDTLLVSSPDVPQPIAVRYAWQANPPATLFNGAGLPAAPFRTDDWPVSTQKR